MPRINVKEDYSARQIVSVKNGAISLNTDDFDHLMVISSAPAVLGNSPEQDHIEDYEKVAFLGQVPVDVIGRVNSGDFIIPSGDNDGFGLAIDPTRISASQINEIVGVAWENGLNDGFNTVNVAVGLTNNASAQLLIGIETEMGALSSDISDVKNYLLQKKHVDSTNDGGPNSSKEQVYKFKDWKAESVAHTKEERLSKLSKPADLAVSSNTNDKPAIEYPEFHAEQLAAEESEDASDIYYEMYIEQTAAALDGLASIDEGQSFVQKFSNETSFNPVNTVEPSVSAFAQRITENLFSAENITSEIRRSVLGANSFGAVKGIRPGTSAEKIFVQEVQKKIMDALVEAEGY